MFSFQRNLYGGGEVVRSNDTFEDEPTEVPHIIHAKGYGDLFGTHVKCTARYTMYLKPLPILGKFFCIYLKKRIGSLI